MFDIGSILPALLENFAKLSPVRITIIHDYERGVKFSWGRFRAVLGPGPHVYFNWWQSVQSLCVVTQCVETQKLALTTKDERCLMLSVAVQFSIEQADLYYLQIQDFEKSLLNMIEGECSRVISKADASEILADPQRFGDKIATYTRRVAKAWGCSIENVSMPNLALTRVYRLVGN